MGRGAEVRFDVKEQDWVLCGAPEVISSDLSLMDKAVDVVE